MESAEGLPNPRKPIEKSFATLKANQTIMEGSH
jgi:hypothetical protein